MSRAGVIALALVAFGVSAVPAQAHLLSRTTAQVKAGQAAAALARARSGESQTRFTRPACGRRNVHRFVCRTVISGRTSCGTGETACDGPADYAIPYEIGVFFRDGRTFVVRTGPRVLQ